MGKIKTKLIFCTLFDSNYLAQGLTMIESLLNVNNAAVIYVAAMDDLSYKRLSVNTNPRIKVIDINEIEEAYPKFKQTKTIRSKPEYYYSTKGFVCHYILSKKENIELITYIDSDLYFFSDPQPIFDELQGASVGITKHNFHWLCFHQKKYGVYNAGWVTFKSDVKGKKCLEAWMDDCINWCFAYLEGEKYADQKYLNTWSKKFLGVKTIQTKGVNVAPWNIKKYKVKKIDDLLYVDNDKLIFYHFSNLKLVNSNEFRTNLSRVFVSTSGIVKEQLYKPYIEALIKNKFNRITPILKKRNTTFKDKFLSFERHLRNIIYNDRISI